jgi:hypothetical protein
MSVFTLLHVLCMFAIVSSARAMKQRNIIISLLITLVNLPNITASCDQPVRHQLGYDICDRPGCILEVDTTTRVFKCSPCGEGMYQETMFTCNFCPMGKISPRQSSSSAQCITCQGGTYFSGESCFNCPAGKYRVTGGANILDCENCPENEISYPGSSDFTDCFCNLGFRKIINSLYIYVYIFLISS